MNTDLNNNGSTEFLNFSDALNHLRRDDRITRRGWNGKGMHIAIQYPDPNSKMKRPYIYMYPIDGMLVPWVASQTDLLAEDWFVLSENN